MSEPMKALQIVSRMDPQALIQTAVEKGASVETLERLFSLAKQIREEVAKQAYNEAKAAFQRECPQIVKDSRAEIPGKYEYRYASLDHILKIALPVLTRNGLSVSYTLKTTATHVSAVARLTHSLGHFEESGEVAMPIPRDGSGANEPQRVGIAQTYAQRYAFKGVSGIEPQGEDTDGNAGEGRANPKKVDLSKVRKAEAKPAATEPVYHDIPGARSPDLKHLELYERFGRMESVDSTPTKAEQAYMDEHPEATHADAVAALYKGMEPHPRPKAKISRGQRQELIAMAREFGWQPTEMRKFLKSIYGFDSSMDITQDCYDEICRTIQMRNLNKQDQQKSFPSSGDGQPEPANP